MTRHDSNALINTVWQLVIEKGQARSTAARKLGISEQRVDRIINAVDARRRDPDGRPVAGKGRPCVVLLEDDPLAAELTERVLRECGADADFIHTMDQSQYLDALEQRRVEVVISDSSVMDLSPETAVQLARQRHPAAGFIILSGRIDPGQAEKARAAGILMAVPKTAVRDIVPQVLKILSAAAAKPWLG